MLITLLYRATMQVLIQMPQRDFTSAIVDVSSGTHTITATLSEAKFNEIAILMALVLMLMTKRVLMHMMLIHVPYL